MDLSDNTEAKPDRQKYLYLGIGILLTSAIIMAGTVTLTGFVFLAILWMVGIFIYQRSKEFSKWSQSNMPLKDYLILQRETKAQNSNTKTLVTTDVSLDDQYDTGLSPTEAGKWDSFVEEFQAEINDFDIIKPKENKKRKPKD